MNATEILKKYWGFDSFRLNQGDIVANAINGFDTFALLPTGGGKSICFQVPGLAREGICIVVSPLIALMQDQVKNLHQRGIKAAAITSGMSRREIDIILDNAKFGGMKFLYVSPERLKTELFLTRFKQMHVGLIAVDEAHCISEWGHDFRPPYLDIHELREIHKNVPIIAVTATATERVKEDIKNQLKLRKPKVFEGDFTRSNISYEVYHVKNKINAILSYCKKFQGQSGIVYCQTRKDTKEVAKLLMANQFSAGIYNGGMDNESRKKQLDLWLNDKIRIMVATNAFGMGIDKPDVRFVLHYEVPNNLEAYFQEAGRSGRDGKASRNLAFIEQKDIPEMEKKLVDQFPPMDFVKTVYRALCNHFSIAIGSGKNESYGLELSSFVKKYGFQPLQAFNALKILSLNKTITLDDAIFQPTRLKFAVNNKTLYNFQIKNEKFDPLISYLSRSFPGIFENFKKIQEKQIAEKLKMQFSELKRQLSTLENQGIIDIEWQTDLPQVYFMHERLPDEYLRIDAAIYANRKDIAWDKFQAMKHFLTADECRSVLLLRYFGQEGKPCGKCDYCLAQNEKNYSDEELTTYLLNLLKDESLTLLEIQQTMQILSSQQVQKLLNWLLDEEKIIFDHGKYRSA
ncbi:MAG: RecQ family ATP-dependent DNA helicase [Crocinitomicaceae bacterium]|nr:RecQ family ATP-dependent DNA helicase [Crocinitomicaceae bacterium]